MNNEKEKLLTIRENERRKKNLELPMLYSIALPVGIIAGYHDGGFDSAYILYSFMLALTIAVSGAAIERLSKPIYTGKHANN